MKPEIHFIYKAMRNEPETIPFHVHSCYELVWYIRGRGIVETKEARFSYRANSIVIVPPDTFHNEINLEARRNLVIGFSLDFRPPNGLFSANPTMISVLQNILFEMGHPRAYAGEIIHLQFRRLILLLLRGDDTAAGNDFSFILRNINSYIDENLSLPVSIQDFAEMHNYSPDRFRHLFRQNAGISFRQYVLEKRLTKAKYLLETTDKPLTAIAGECGFYDLSQFSRLFKRHYRLAPSKFRQQCEGRKKGTEKEYN